MEGLSKFSKATEKVGKVLYRTFQAVAFTSILGSLPNVAEGQNTPETQASRAQSEQTIIKQIEDKMLGMKGSMSSLGSGLTKIKSFEKDGKIITIGYSALQDKAEWVMITEGDSLLFVDRDLDGNPDRIVINKDHKGKMGIAFNELDGFSDIDGIAKKAPTRSSLSPENKFVVDIGSTVKMVSLKSGDAAEGSLEEAKSDVDRYQIQFGNSLKDIEMAVTSAQSKK